MIVTGAPLNACSKIARLSASRHPELAHEAGLRSDPNSMPSAR